MALQIVEQQCDCDDGQFPKVFDVGVLVDLGISLVPASGVQIAQVVEEVFTVRRWRGVHHHEAHALLGYYASPFNSALIVSYDGGGDDGNTNVFFGSGMSIHRVAKSKSNFGAAYGGSFSLAPEVWRGGDTLHTTWCAILEADQAEHPTDPPRWMNNQVFRPIEEILGDSGKIMGYSGIANPANSSVEIQAAVKKFLDVWLGSEEDQRWPYHEQLVSWSRLTVPSELMDISCQSREDQYQIAAEVQHQWQKRLQKVVAHWLSLASADRTVEGIVLSGGSALNVLANQYIRETLTQASQTGSSSRRSPKKPLDVYVPPAPNDAGLTVGGIWAVTPPRFPQSLQYVGFRLFDENLLEGEAQRRGARRLSKLGDVEFLAELLTGGPAWLQESGGRTEKPIIAVVRGRQEFGPRALGHRSLLAVPDSEGAKDRLNKVKHRAWYRPVAPMIADEALEEVFGKKYKSVTMEFAPKVLEHIRKKFPALAHFDGTARHQSVGKDDEPWVHALLLAVGKRTGLAALINTSFNSRGKPIVNKVMESLKMLDSLPGLDYVVIEDWLFKAPAVKMPLTKEELAQEEFAWQPF
eukprot:TRINITY_DN24362_c0_g1_i8.p1 TRINITY_DN24362_c0_g1~~TRINITY_DN24362_c0_g1_i8.p1  ORF type:complete len:670 (+),score=99.67 TRINITY_DN24362_c0_g1_i8:273-2012(+)